MRRVLAIFGASALLVILGAPASAQSGVEAGDNESFDATFTDTDDACGFGNYTDTYIATTGEDENGRFVDLEQMSTGDSGRLRLDENGNPFIEPAITEEQWTVLAFIGEVLGGQYSYQSDDCIQLWRAELLLPPGYFQFLLDGQAASVPETTTTVIDTTTTVIDTTLETTVETVVAITEGTAEPGSEISDDSGNNFVLLLPAAVVILLLGWGWYWWFIQRPKRLYRFDRGDPGEIVPDEKPPGHRLCDDAHKHWRESVDRLTQLEQEADDRVGTKDAISDMRMDMIDQARASMDVYKRNYDECVEAHLDDEGPSAPSGGGGGSAPPEPTEPEPGGEEPDDGGPVSPGIITPPPEPTAPKPEKGCANGTSKTVIDKQKTITVAGGNITIRGAGNKSRFGGSGISEADLSDMDSGDLEDIFEGIEDMGAENKVTVTIPTTLLTIKCIRIMHCENKAWVETDRTRLVETAKGPNRLARWRSQEQRGSGRQMTAQVKPILAELKAAQAEADSYTCN